MTRRRAAIVSAYAGILTAVLVFGTRSGFATFIGLLSRTEQRADAADGAVWWSLWTALNGMVSALMGP